MKTIDPRAPRPTPETDAVLVNHMPKGATEWSDHYVTMCIHSRKLERERDEAREQLKRTFDELYEEQQKHGITKAHLTECQMQIKAMREVIREVFDSFADEPASDSAWLLDDRQTAALTKLQPFIKP